MFVLSFKNETENEEQKLRSINNHFCQKKLAVKLVRKLYICGVHKYCLGFVSFCEFFKNGHLVIARFFKKRFNKDDFFCRFYSGQKRAVMSFQMYMSVYTFFKYPRHVSLNRLRVICQFSN